MKSMKEPNDKITDREMGLFMILGVLFLTSAWMWWKDISFGPAPQKFRIVFSDIAGLANNAAVQINGMRVGNVEDIDLAGNNRVLVTVKISNSKVRVPSGSRASIYANGIIGSKYIEIRLPDKSGKKALGENDLIAGEPTYRPELLVEQLSKQANELDIARLQNTMIAEMQRVGRAADGATAVYGRIGRAADGASMLYGRIGHAADQASALSSRLGGISSSATPVLGKIGKAADNTTALVNRLGSTAEKTNKLEDQLMGLAQDLSKKTNNELNQLLSKTFCMEDRVTALADELNLRSKTDLKGALITTKCAMGQTAIVGKQLSQIMDKRAPILQLLFGRPGHLKAPVVCPTQIAVPETAATESIKEKAIIIDTK